MTGPEHYLEAERLLSQGGERATIGVIGLIDTSDGARSRTLAQAQVHATLALAAATALGGFDTAGMAEADFEAWDRVSGVADPCTRCQGGSREATGMKCQACGRGYSVGGRDAS